MFSAYSATNNVPMQEVFALTMYSIKIVSLAGHLDKRVYDKFWATYWKIQKDLFLPFLINFRLPSFMEFSERKILGSKKYLSKKIKKMISLLLT